MSVVSWVLQAEKRFAWSLAGTVVGLIALVLTVWALQEKHPSVGFVVTNESNVFDVHTSVPDLQISFRGQNVQAQNLNLRVITVRIENSGDVDILQAQYAQEQLWGFEVEPGTIVEARVIGSTSSYLLRASRPTVSGDSVILPKVILERGRSVTLDLLVLHQKDVNPSIRAFGKIAGIEQFNVSRRTPDNEQTFFERAFSGSIFVQLTRVLVYGFGALVVLFIAALVTAAGFNIHESLAKRRRYKELRPLRDMPADELKFREVFMRLYVDKGERGITIARRLLDNTEIWSRIARERDEMREAGMPDHRNVERAITDAHGNLYLVRETSMIARLLRKHGVVSVDGVGAVSVSPSARSALEEVIAFIAASRTRHHSDS
jgi:hypothetical protein